MRTTEGGYQLSPQETKEPGLNQPAHYNRILDSLDRNNLTSELLFESGPLEQQCDFYEQSLNEYSRVTVQFGPNGEYSRDFANFEEFNNASIKDWEAYFEEHNIPDDVLDSGYRVSVRVSDPDGADVEHYHIMGVDAVGGDFSLGANDPSISGSSDTLRNAIGNNHTLSFTPRPDPTLFENMPFEPEDYDALSFEDMCKYGGIQPTVTSSLVDYVDPDSALGRKLEGVFDLPPPG